MPSANPAEFRSAGETEPMNYLKFEGNNTSVYKDQGGGFTFFGFQK